MPKWQLQEQCVTLEAAAAVGWAEGSVGAVIVGVGGVVVKAMGRLVGLLAEQGQGCCQQQELARLAQAAAGCVAVKAAGWVGAGMEGAGWVAVKVEGWAGVGWVAEEKAGWVVGKAWCAGEGARTRSCLLMSTQLQAMQERRSVVDVAQTSVTMREAVARLGSQVLEMAADWLLHVHLPNRRCGTSKT